MENSVIAVQIADGTFVPVLSTSGKKRRRLVLTTVRDDQTNVKIELFRGSDESMSDPEYVGSLVIDNVEPAEKGSADISVLLGVDENGNLNATATDTTSGEYQSLSVGLEELDEGGYDVPDFQLSDEELTLDELSMEEEEIGGEDEADLSADLSTGDEEPLGDFDLGDFETELDEGEEGAGGEAAAPTADVAETPTQPPEPTELDELDLESADDEPADDEPAGELEDLGEIDLGEPVHAETAGGEEETEELDLGPTEQSPEEEPEELDLSGLEQELEEETDELDLSGLDEELEPAPAAPETEGGEELGDLSFDDLETPGEDELESLEELELDEEEAAPAPEDTALAGEPEPLDQPAAEAGEEELSLDDLGFDDEFGLEPEGPTDEAGRVTEQADTLADISDDAFSFDESFSEEGFGAAETEPQTAEPQTGEPETAGDFDLSSLTAEEGGEEGGFDVGTDFQEGMVEADLGEEDFTFDEGAEDEPLFGEPDVEPVPEPAVGGEEIEDTLSPEEFDRLDSQPAPAAPEPEAGEEPLAPRRSNAIVFVGYLVLALAALGVLTYLVFRLMEGPPAPPLRASLLGHLATGSIVWGRPLVGRAGRRG